MSQPGLRRLSSPAGALAAGMLAGAAGIIWQTRGHTLLFDEWSFFADYRDWSPSVLLNPFGGNLELVPLLIYKVVFEAFGPQSVALRLVLVALNLTCATLFFVLARRRVDEWIAAAAALLLVLLGAAADVVAATLGIAILCGVACGLGALLALEREDGRGDALACALLALGLASNTVAVPFVAGAAVRVLFVGDRAGLRRLWVALGPLLLFGVWWLWSQHLDPLGPLAAHPTRVNLTNIGNLPSSVAESLAAATVTTTGLFRPPGASGVHFSDALGAPLAVALIGFVVIRLRRRPPPSRAVLVFAAMPLVYWALIAIFASDRLPDVSRYQYAGAIFLLLLLAELASGIPIGTRARIAVIGALCFALLPNLLNLHESAKFLRFNAQLDRAELASIEIAAGRVDPNLLIEPIGGRFDERLESQIAGGRFETTTDAVISAGRYLYAARELGSAAYSIDELEASPREAREAADRELAVALRIEAQVADGRITEPAGCIPYPAPIETTAPLRVPLPAGGFEVRANPGPPVGLALRRFGDRFGVDLGQASGGAVTAVRIPADRQSGLPAWRARIAHAQKIEVCPLP